MMHITHYTEKISADLASPGSSLLKLYPVEGRDQETLPFILVLPGGGYSHLAPHEGEPVARWFNQLGIHAGVLHYQLDPVVPSNLIQDVEDAISWVREAPHPWNVNPKQVGMIGFSAGGHLASIAAVKGTAKPDLLLLGYPVITFAESYTHEGSRQRFLGDHPHPEHIQDFSSDRQVSMNTPPTFMWTTSDDAAVPVENSLLFAGALSKAGIPFELHVFEEGRHGLGLSEENLHCRQWLGCCASWLQHHHFTKRDS
ncbi:alpha/beta hydrolase [Paenibacillus dendrobii]|uniref:alpha/beta hydrolase n=1 Tax=Paenibacillus dendrobii TaxID=2691084 RepID=UPI001F2BDF66|nr:alpha/beta hydrolase [Paenibacillus dendrobii]